ncbi:MAG: ACP S-malonyltransferase [Acidobacteriota bacterium]|nr:ACP S-malonyltransferase [Acidobacteriota bacterium]
MGDTEKTEISKTKIAYVFPGQGSQVAGMGKDLYDNFPTARRVFEEADDTLGFPISQMCFAGTAEELALTENTQPAILTVSVAAFRAMKSEGFPLPDYVAGHSLGEYSALVSAGAINFADAVRIVRLRGRFMQEAVPVGVGAMAAILGADLQTVEQACAEAAENQICSAANINSPTQIVIAGHAEAVDRAGELLKNRGAKKAIKLNVSAPFHSALMQPAQDRLSVELEKTRFFDLTAPCITNIEAKENDEAERAKDLLIRQVAAPVKWWQSIEYLKSRGVMKYVEVGVGKVLGGLIRQIDREAVCLNVEDAKSLEAAKTALVV